MSQKKQSMNLKTEHRIYSTRETKRIKNSKNSLMDLLAHIKRNNMHIVEIPEVKERKKQMELNISRYANNNKIGKASHKVS